MPESRRSAPLAKGHVMFGNVGSLGQICGVTVQR
jgi:hypothetical protein